MTEEDVEEAISQLRQELLGELEAAKEKLRVSFENELSVVRAELRREFLAELAKSKRSDDEQLKSICKRIGNLEK